MTVMLNKFISISPSTNQSSENSLNSTQGIHIGSYIPLIILNNSIISVFRNKIIKKTLSLYINFLIYFIMIYENIISLHVL